jgi:hypothetical protein
MVSFTAAQIDSNWRLPPMRLAPKHSKTKTHGFERFPHAEKPALIIYGTIWLFNIAMGNP